ncbi:HAAS signaling domain-containing protein [Streptomyces huasconensis]|uniref:HAAS signaling domain-containing protein n=1 Tax=Streptomyces huasconensis TaxID=1854574 RepID=UPI0033E45AFD
MGIESDQLVYDYLSRVGDLAQQRQLPSAARMRLVADLRARIDRSRADAADSPAAIRRILAGLGTPEEIVDGADGAPTDVPKAPPSESKPKTRPAVPTQRAPRVPGGKEGWRLVPRPRRAAKDVPQDLVEGPRPSPPHLAGSDELGPSGSEPDWWRLDSTPFGGADTVPGFVGGVEIPEILKPPPSPDDPDHPDHPDRHTSGDEAPAEAAEESVPGTKRWRRLPRLPARGTGVGFTNPLLLLAAALLLVGAVLGSLPALGGGWLIAYLSRRLTPVEAKAAVFGMPGLALAAGFTWLWGRTEGKWGEPIRDGHMSDAIGETWPWVLRGAAVASALFLVWRSQRRRP